jgi:hypothetical protein
MTIPAHIPTIEPAELTVEEEMQRALARVSLTDQKIAEMVSMAAAVPPVTDPDTEQQALKALKEVNKWSVIGRKNIAAIHQRSVDTWKLSGRVSKEIEGRLREPELLIEAKLAPYRAEQQRKREEQEAMVAAMREQRKNDLLALKYVFVPGPPEHRYELEGVGVSVRDIMDDDELTWGHKMITFRMHGEQVAARIAEEERLRQEEADRLERQRKEQEEREQELARREAEMQRREKEAEEAKEAARKAEVAAVENGRLAELAALGIDAQMYYKQHFLGESIQPPLAEYEPMEWPIVVARAKELIERIVKHEEEAAERIRAEKERQALINERVEKLKAAGYEDTGDGHMLLKTESDQWGFVAYPIFLVASDDFNLDEAVSLGRAELGRRKEAEAAKEAAAEEERKAAMQRLLDAQNKPAEKPAAETLTDEDLWLQWIDAAPKMSSAIGNHGVSSAVKYLKDMTPGLFRDMKQ